MVVVPGFGDAAMVIFDGLGAFSSSPTRHPSILWNPLFHCIMVVFRVPVVLSKVVVVVATALLPWSRLPLGLREKRWFWCQHTSTDDQQQSCKRLHLDTGLPHF